MSTTSTLLLSALFIALSSLHVISSSTIEDLCNTLGGFYVERDWCIATLSADPSSSTLDRKGLGVLATNLTIAKAAVVKAQLEDLAGKATGAVDKNRAEAFLLLHSNMIASLQWSADSISSGFYGGPAAVLDVALAVPAAVGHISGAQESNDLSTLILLSRAIAHNLP